MLRPLLNSRASRPRPRRRALRLGLLASACAVLLTGAGPPGSGLEGLGRVVADEDLGQMRGKFVQPSGVHFFGIELVQSWLGADGVTVQATLQFDVDFARSAAKLADSNARVQVGWSRTCNGCGDPTMDIAALTPSGTGDPAITAAADTLPLNDFTTIRGLVQSQQIAGSDNDVRNAMRIAVVPAGSAKTQGSDGLAEVDASASNYFPGGAVHVIAEKNELGLAITRGDEHVRQSISGSLNQATQDVLLQSSRNDIVNSMGITVGVEDLGQIALPSVSAAMSAMKGRGM